jgi:23S rRNA U2552 (ribose-2'-O)-methylase RlmE/FtsJ
MQVFRSKDYNALLYAFGQLFNKVEATKPQVRAHGASAYFLVLPVLYSTLFYCLFCTVTV